jgi:hypothetical protein
MTLGTEASGTAAGFTAQDFITVYVGIGLAVLAVAWFIFRWRWDKKLLAEDKKLLARLGDGKEPPADDEDETGTRASTDESSWRTFVLPLFGLTVVFAILAFLGSAVASVSTSTSLTTVDLFTDLAGAGALLGGIGTMLAVWISYLDRRRKEKHQADTDTINHVIAHMDRSLKPDDIRALTELARALNGNEDKSRKSGQLEIGPHGKVPI